MGIQAPAEESADVSWCPCIPLYCTAFKIDLIFVKMNLFNIVTSRKIKMETKLFTTEVQTQ